MSNKNGLKVFAPGSVANVAVGYDILGFAINDVGDEVIVRQGVKPGLHIRAIHNNPNIPKDIMKNTASYSAYKLMEHVGAENEAIEMELIKNMGIGTGLGSSAASAVAGVFAVNEYLGKPCSRNELLKFATLGEQIADGAFHADNVAPSLLGGIVLIRDNESLDVVKLPCPSGLRCVLIYPQVEVLTEQARKILTPDISLKQHIRQSGNLGAFVSSLYRSDFELMKRSLSDCVIEPQRSHLIPFFDEVKGFALSENALGFSISGAGPSMFALCNNSIIAENIADGIRGFYSDKNIECNYYISDINLEGAKRY
ncbi:MAG: homoserine kinase [Saprospiraceae bacterium]|nr:homoserine kinase [Bacteroidia bacterium]NNF22118.1 homoserine kinase [Saprospiraceae bacterium]